MQAIGAQDQKDSKTATEIYSVSKANFEKIRGMKTATWELSRD